MSGARVAWITGASSGLGLATARQLADAGLRVVLSARNAEPLEVARADIGGDAQAIVADVTDPASVAAAVVMIGERWGGIDVLVNNAGMNVGARAWGEVTPGAFAGLVDANLNGVFYCADAVLPGMRAQGGGLIVNVASFAGWHVTARPGPGYSATKQAVRALTQSLNMAEFRNGIRACALCPGEIATPAMAKRNPPPSADVLARMLQPDDVARTIRFIVEQPAHVCLNELIISPVWNGAYGAELGGPNGVSKP